MSLPRCVVCTGDVTDDNGIAAIGHSENRPAIHDECSRLVQVYKQMSREHLIKRICDIDLVLRCMRHALKINEQMRKAGTSPMLRPDTGENE